MQCILKQPLNVCVIFVYSARKRPVPYHRPSPTFSDSDSSYVSRHGSRSPASRSRFRSLSRSPSLDIYHRRKKYQHHQQQQHHQPSYPKPISYNVMLPNSLSQSVTHSVSHVLTSQQHLHSSITT